MVSLSFNRSFQSNSEPPYGSWNHHNYVTQVFRLITLVLIFVEDLLLENAVEGHTTDYEEECPWVWERNRHLKWSEEEKRRKPGGYFWVVMNASIICADYTNFQIYKGWRRLAVFSHSLGAIVLERKIRGMLFKFEILDIFSDFGP